MRRDTDTPQPHPYLALTCTVCTRTHVHACEYACDTYTILMYLHACISNVYIYYLSLIHVLDSSRILYSMSYFRLKYIICSISKRKIKWGLVKEKGKGTTILHLDLLPSTSLLHSALSESSVSQASSLVHIHVHLRLHSTVWTYTYSDTGESGHTLYPLHLIFRLLPLFLHQLLLFEGSWVLTPRIIPNTISSPRRPTIGTDIRDSTFESGSDGGRVLTK